MLLASEGGGVMPTTNRKEISMTALAQKIDCSDSGIQLKDDVDRIADTVRPGRYTMPPIERAAYVVRSYEAVDPEHASTVRDAFVSFFRLEDRSFDLASFLQECAP